MSRHSQRGVAAIELAIILGPLLTVCFAGLECSVALQRYQALHQSTVSAVRFLSLSKAGDPVAAQLAQCLVLTGRTEMKDGTCLAPPIIPNTSILNVLVCDRVNCPSTHNGALASGQVLPLVSIQTQGMVMTDFPEWMSAWVFPDIQVSMVQISS